MNAILLLSPLHLVWDFRRYFMSAPEVGFLYVGRVWRGKTQQTRQSLNLESSRPYSSEAHNYNFC